MSIFPSLRKRDWSLLEARRKSPLIPIPHGKAMNENNPDNGFGAATPSDPFQAAKASAMKAAEELRQTAAQKLKAAAEGGAQQFREAAETVKDAAQERAGQFRDAAGEAWSDARVKYDDIRTEAERLTREKPMQAVLTAFGVGLFIGLILRR